MRQWIKRLMGKYAASTKPNSVHTQGSSNSVWANDAKTPIDKYSSDQPIRSKAEDRFNRASFASRIAETIATRTDPSSIVIGLYGPWGDGKTSTLQMMEEELVGRPHVVVVKFNPWHFQSEEQLLKGFFATLGSALGRSLPTLKEKVGKAFSDYGSLLSLASFTIGGVVQLRPGDAVKGVGEAMSAVELAELRTRIEAILMESGKRVVVLIDDIDRLDRVETHAILKLVKLSASFDYTSYVLAFDDQMVAAAIGDRYSSGGIEAGRSFLEKIIQVPLHLPPPDEISLRQMAFEGVDAALKQACIDLTQAQIDSFVRHFINGLESRMTTPRHVKLYTNALTFALPLLKGEANAVEVMLIEGLRVFCPDLYAAIRDNPDLFLDGHDLQHNQTEQRKKRLAALIEAGLPGVPEDERNALRTGLLEVLFPRIGEMIYGHDWDERWSEEQRVCSSEYFKRYFTYAVPPGEVSDLEVNDVLQRFTTFTSEQQDSVLRGFEGRSSLPKLIHKLRAKEQVLSQEIARPLLLAVCRNGTLIPVERGPFKFNSTRMQGGILVAHLLRRITVVAEREDIAIEVVQTAEPIAFALESFRWMWHDKDKPEDQRLLSAKTEELLRSLLAQRIAAQATLAPLYLTEGSDTPWLYWMWNNQTKNGAVATHLRAAFAANSDHVDLFLDTFVGEAWGLTTGLPQRADLRRENYDAIAELIDPLVIMDCLRQRYGAELDLPTYHPDDRTPVAQRIANQFAFLHKAATEQKANQTANVA